MTIRYAHGHIFEAILVSRTETAMRVAIEGYDDSLDLKRIHGMWVTEDCDPVDLQFV